MDNVEIIERMQDKLYDELETYVDGELKSTSCLDAVDKLLHSIKSASTVLAMEGYDRGSSGVYGRTYVGTGGSYGYQQGGRRGYDRGRSRGSDDEYMRHLQALKEMAPDAQSIQRMIDERR